MASAQVLPSSRKQEHLAAGKRRLEEFRKKKAADRAKKSNSSNVADGPVNETRLSDGQLALLVKSDGAVGPPSIAETNNGPSDILQRSEQESEVPTYDTVNSVSGSSAHTHTKDDVYIKNNAFPRSNGPVDHTINQETKETKSDSRKSSGSYQGFASSLDIGNVETLSREKSSNLKDLLFKIPESSSDLVTNGVNNHGFSSFSQEKELTSASTPPWGISSLSYNQEANQPSSTKAYASESGQLTFDVAKFDVSEKSDMEERKLSGSFGGFPGEQSVAPYTSSQHTSSAYSSDHSNSSDQTPLYLPISDSHPRRSRPSFLDSLNVPRASPAFPFKSAESTESKESVFRNESGNRMDSLGQSVSGTQYTDCTTSSATTKSNSDHFPVSGGLSVDRKPDFYLPKQNEDFAALEQHIEDLTQEKFSLQRALEASRALAESLASENSSLTDSYNQQRGAVNQLKDDMEKLQEEISQQLAELEAIKHEYANAQLECNAADERAKILASEVIGLEEKALRLRSSELKLERQLENSQEEIAAYKKKVAILEKDRLDLQSTINALQEERKVLHSKLRKSSGGKAVEVNQSSSNKKDVSTSTDDIDASISTSPLQMEDSRSVIENDTPITLSSDTQSNFEASFGYIPPDQLRMIENISTIMSELALEKEELVKALASEVSDNSKLRGLNKELSRKLEAQTQRLELLTAQSMINDSMPAKLPDAHPTIENTAYADEGDEVVERVLGWIMKLFPGGPSRRRTSKHL